MAFSAMAKGVEYTLGDQVTFSHPSYKETANGKFVQTNTHTMLTGEILSVKFERDEDGEIVWVMEVACEIEVLVRPNMNEPPKRIFRVIEVTENIII